jgi:large subunit ribosomal protein L21
LPCPPLYLSVEFIGPEQKQQGMTISMFAIVDIAGTQEKVEKGMKLWVPFNGDTEADKTLTFENVLLFADGDTVKVGAPFLTGITIAAKVLGHVKDDKVRIQKFMRRKRYRRVKGHRQPYTEVEITGITVK